MSPSAKIVTAAASFSDHNFTRNSWHTLREGILPWPLGSAKEEGCYQVYHYCIP